MIEGQRNELQNLHLLICKYGMVTAKKKNYLKSRTRLFPQLLIAG